MSKRHTYKKSTIINKNTEYDENNADTYYIDKKEFYNALVQRSHDIIEAKKNNKPIPQVSDYIGKCIIDICTNLAKRHQFSGYYFKDEMISDAIYHCIRYIDSFDITKSENPFSYYSQAAYYQFIKRISLEKEQLYIRCKTTMQSVVLSDSLEEDTAGNSDFNHDNVEMDTEYMDDFINEYEKKDREKRRKAKETKARKDLERKKSKDKLEIIFNED